MARVRLRWVEMDGAVYIHRDDLILSLATAPNRDMNAAVAPVRALIDLVLTQGRPETPTKRRWFW